MFNSFKGFYCVRRSISAFAKAMADEVRRLVVAWALKAKTNLF